METPMQSMLKGNKSSDLRRHCEYAVLHAHKFGVEDIKGACIHAVKEVMSLDGKIPPVDDLIKYYVEQAMAGKELPMDFVDTKD